MANYLTFSSPNSFTLKTYNTTKNWDGILEYSTDTSTWNTWNGTTTLSADNGKLYLRGTGNTAITIGARDDETSRARRWVLTGNNIACEGNIENLLDYQTVADGRHPVMADKCYTGMFYQCDGLSVAPELPATTLTLSCYSAMFYMCTNLTTPPALPATTLAKNCYNMMFTACIKLKVAPALPATTLADYCYRYMFNGCTNLTTAPELPATILANSCYTRMFDSCHSLTTAPELPATDLEDNCYSSMFERCLALTTAPKLPATILKPYCYENMFYGCTNLTTAPELPAMHLAQGCYLGMFGSCRSLTAAPELLATTLENNCYISMFSNCSALVTIPELPATTLKVGCYRNMFSGCSQLKLSASPTEEYCNAYRIPMNGDGIDADNALTDMFTNTGGTFTGTPIINVIYYTSNEIASTDTPEGIPIISITYDSETIAALEVGQEATIKTAETEVEHDIIVTARDIMLQKKVVTENGSITPDEGYDGFSKVIVDIAPKLQEKTTTTNGIILPDKGYYGLAKATIDIFVPENYKGTIKVVRTPSTANTTSEGD